MDKKYFYFIFKTDIGWMGILASDKGLIYTTLPQNSEPEARQLLGENHKQAEWSPQFFQDLFARFEAYFNGQKVVFNDELDLDGATSFERAVWETTRQVPYGETRSYRWVAEQIRKARAARAVGQALGKNPLPIVIPCHRIIASNGGLCGFGGGLKMKKQLLDLEARAKAKIKPKAT